MKKSIIALALCLLAASAAAQNIVRSTELYAVKGTDSLYLDRYTSQAESLQPRPCMFFVFGGGFVSGQRDAEQYMPYFEHLVRRGFDVVSIDYRLGLRTAAAAGLTDPMSFVKALTGSISMAVEDLFSATAYAIDNAERWNIDPQRIAASGSSAGAITVLHAEYEIANRRLLARMLPEGFDYSGVISFAGAILSFDGRLEWSSAPAPMLLFHGDADSNVPYDVLREDPLAFFGSKSIAASLSAGNFPHWFYSIHNADHSIAVSPMHDHLSDIDSFLDKFVTDRLPLIIDTSSRRTDSPEADKNFSLMDYVRANFAQ